MNATNESVQNYYQSAEKFMNAYFDFLVSMYPDSDKPEVQKAAADYKEKMDKFMDAMTKLAEEEISKNSDMTPEQVQQANVQAITEFENGYKQASDFIMQTLDKEKQYMESDQYLEDIKNNKTAAQSMYNSSLDGMSRVLDTYSNLFKGMNK